MQDCFHQRNIDMLTELSNTFKNGEEIFYPSYSREDAEKLLWLPNRKNKLLVRKKVHPDHPSWRFVISFYDASTKECDHIQIFLKSNQNMVSENNANYLPIYFTYGEESDPNSENFGFFVSFLKEKFYPNIFRQPFPESGPLKKPYSVPSLIPELEFELFGYKKGSPALKGNQIKTNRTMRFSLKAKDESTAFKLTLDGSFGNPEDPKKDETKNGVKYLHFSFSNPDNSCIRSNSFVSVKNFVNSKDKQTGTIEKHEVFVGFTEKGTYKFQILDENGKDVLKNQGIIIVNQGLIEVKEKKTEKKLKTRNLQNKKPKR